MKGVIFCYLKEFIEERYGLETWYELIDLCPLKQKPPYVKPGNYSHFDFLSIVDGIANKVGESSNIFIKEFGKATFQRMARDYPVFVEKYDHPKPFLLTVDGIIHVEVQKLFSNAELPQFYYEDVGENALIIRYQSERKLCPLMEGLILGATNYFQYNVNITHDPCMHQGSDHCKFLLRFTPQYAEAID